MTFLIQKPVRIGIRSNRGQVSSMKYVREACQMWRCVLVRQQVTSTYCSHRHATHGIDDNLKEETIVIEIIRILN
jgi:hypothetical protein